MDQHDKWKCFGLYWHGCLDGFTGKILWLIVWWTNSNPRFVCAQYLEAMRNFSGMLVLYFIMGLSYTKRPWHRELQCCICPYPSPPRTWSLAFWHYPTPVDAWSFKHQTRTNVVAIPLDVDPWLRECPAERHQPAVVSRYQCCRQVCNIPYTHGLKNLQNIMTDLFFVGWPSLGCRRQLIRMYITTTQAAEGQVVAMPYQMKSRMSCLKTRKS